VWRLWHPSRPISRILYSTRERQPSIWGARYRTPQCGLPGAERVRAAPCPQSEDSLLLGLAPDGVCPAEAVTNLAGGLLHHLFTLTPALCEPRRYTFCGTMPSDRSAWLLASIVLYGVRTFLIPRRTRLPGQLGPSLSIAHRRTNVKRNWVRA
jgi:hypothetical protein